MTLEQYRAYLTRRASKDRVEGIPAPKPEPTKKRSLERVEQGEKEGRIRAFIRFTVYAVRPMDWDNYRFKELQDCLIKAGILDDDKWDVLEGSVRSFKVDRKEEERTEITIQSLC